MIIIVFHCIALEALLNSSATCWPQLHNPLHAMHGAIAQLASGALTAAATVEVASLTHGIDVMIGVSNDLLDVEALRRGRLRVKPAPTDIRQVLSA